MADLKNITKQEYPNWAHSIPKNPSEEQFLEAWKNEYGFNINNYKAEVVEWGGQKNLEINTNNDKIIIFNINNNQLTYEPKLSDQKIFYSGQGSDWLYDDNNKKFLLIDKETRLPPNFKGFCNKEIITKYITNELNNKKI